MMPHLTYKYMMNEPFVAGTQATTQSSHQQFLFKRARDLTNPNNEPMAEVKKSEEEVKDEQERMWEELNNNIKNQDITKLVIKQDCDELFGLEIAYRKSYDM